MVCQERNTKIDLFVNKETKEHLIMRRVLLITTLFALVMTSCRSVKKYTERGKYREAVDYAVNRLQRNKTLKDKEVKSLQLSVDKFQTHILRDIERTYRATGQPWAKIRGKINDLDYVQKRISGVLPIVGKDGYKAYVRFVNVGKLQEKALFEANQKDLDLIDVLEKQGEQTSYLRIAQLYEAIQKRQRDVAASGSIVGVEGTVPDFNFADVTKLHAEAHERAAGYLYNKTLPLVAQARAGDKRMARRAFYKLSAVHDVIQDFKNVKDLQSDMKDLGHVTVDVVVLNRTGFFLPFGMQRDIQRTNIERLNNNWTSYRFVDEQDTDGDVRAIFEIVSIDVSPNKEDVNVDHLHKEIQDGWVYVDRDKSDTIKTKKKKEPRMIKIEGDWTQVNRSKYGEITTEVRYEKRHEEETVRSNPIHVEFAFQNEAFFFDGDMRLLTSSMKCKLNQSDQPFPSDDTVIDECVSGLKDNLYSELGKRVFDAEWYR